MNNSAGIFQVDDLLATKLRGTPLESHVEVVATIEGETEKRLLTEFRLPEAEALADESTEDAARGYGLRARTIAEPACSWTRWVSRISIPSRPAAASSRRNSSSVRAPAMQPVHCSHVAAGRLVHVRVGDDVGDREAATRPEHPSRLAEDPGLVGGEVDDAVRDHHVDGLVGQRDLLDRSLDELDVRPRPAARWLPRASSSISSVMSSPYALPRRADPAGREQDVDAAAGAEIEDGFALVELGDGRRVSAAQRSELRRVGKRVALLAGVELGAEDLPPRRPGRSSRSRRRIPPGRSSRGARARRPGRLGVALADGVADSSVVRVERSSILLVRGDDLGRKEHLREVLARDAH